MSSKVDEKKSTKIDVAPERLRTIAHQEMMLSGFSAEMRKPIWDGLYDLEHLQAIYETAVGLGRDATASAIAALAAWARVYPEGHGSEKRLTGGAKAYKQAMGATILPPIGAPFAVVGTDEARDVVDYFVSYAIDADVEQGATTTRADYPEGERLIDLLAHRDHLHAQVGEVQARNAALEVANRKMRIWSEGLMARLSAGAEEPACPYRSDDDAAVMWWTQGYAHANSLVNP